MYYRVVRQKDGLYRVERSIGGRVWLFEALYGEREQALRRMDLLADGLVGRRRRRSYLGWRRRVGSSASRRLRIAMITSASVSSTTTRK